MNEKRQQQQLDAGTIADMIWEAWKRDGHPLNLTEELLEKQNDSRIKNW